ncbi:hypothetical protein KNT66_gp07 [Burkholderia phage FLC5]|uniref:Uncharacterized protein n=1 Tax=Burkholderia phage FLC5 TaxID=2716322 RepID=A0A7G1GMH7_9CAUD|nr:hypothetical protein KNT66_gp07 [Burkholderia phage FLC5]BCB23179.1 hypothetical protein [Burkholderia phage FLC5]
MTNDTAQLAGMLPHNRAFREWVTTWLTTPELATVDEAAQFIRYVCEVESRAELATNKEAAQRFHTILRRTFIAWRDARHRSR